ncbi:hypothetical protein WG66_011176 [Moniliophthora roreri]|nr:hypothetical protein WG66_011176 [Moniliophthora roreri]
MYFKTGCHKPVSVAMQVAATLEICNKDYILDFTLMYISRCWAPITLTKPVISSLPCFPSFSSLSTSMSTKTPGKAKLKISTGSGASKQHTITIGKAHLDTDTSHKPKTTRSKSQCPVELNRHGSEVQAHQQDVSIALNDSSCSAVAQNTDMLPQINYNYDNSWIGSDIDIAMTDAPNPHSDDQDHSSTDAESQERTEDKYWYALDKLQAVFRISNEEYVSQDWDAEQDWELLPSHAPANKSEYFWNILLMSEARLPPLPCLFPPPLRLHKSHMHHSPTYSSCHSCSCNSLSKKIHILLYIFHQTV